MFPHLSCSGPLRPTGRICGRRTPAREDDIEPSKEAIAPPSPRIRHPFALARTALARIRNRVHGLLHPFRHRRAIKAVRGTSSIDEVLFVCLGNICRSPYAEARLRHLFAESAVGDRIRVRSVGFITPGRPPPDAAVQVARERGLDLAEHRSRVIARERVDGADLILVMTTRQRRDLRRRFGRADILHLGDLDPGPIDRRDVPDPIERPPDEFRRVYSRIDRALRALSDAIVDADRASRLVAR